MTTTSEIPAFPMTRAAGCPFDPPPAARALQEEAPLARVKLWDGSTPWLVTRYAEQRALLEGAAGELPATPTGTGSISRVNNSTAAPKATDTGSITRRTG